MIAPAPLTRRRPSTPGAAGPPTGSSTAMGSLVGGSVRDGSVVSGRRWLAGELARLRRAAGLTQAEAAAAVGWSTSKQIRIEMAQVGLSPAGVRALTGLYGVTDAAQVRQLCAAATANRRGRWQRYRDVLTPGMRTYLDVEDTATTISMFRHSLIPDPLHTIDYARTVHTALAAPSWSRQQVRQRTHAGLDRQALLDRPDLARLEVLLDEAVVTALARGDRVMRDQLAHLRLLADRPQVTVRYLPYDFGVHMGLHRQFTLLEFPGERAPALYRHAHLDHAERHPQLDEYTRLYAAMRAAARDLSRFTSPAEVRR